MATDGNVNIENRGDEIIVQIRPRFRIWRLLAIPPILAISWLGMSLISFMVMASFLEWWGTEGPYWIELCLFFGIGIVGHYLAAMLFVVSFIKETVILNSWSLRYRCTLFGIGFTRSYKIEEIGIQIIPESVLGHNPITQFFGLSKPRFRIWKACKSKAIGGDVNDAGASKIANVLRLRHLTG